MPRTKPIVYATTGPLPGTVCAQYIRCGKVTCKCYSENFRHGPYYYRVWREGKRIQKSYVPIANVVHVQAQCDLHKHHLAELSAIRKRRKSLTLSRRHLRRTFVRLQKELARNLARAEDRYPYKHNSKSGKPAEQQHFNDRDGDCRDGTED